jgi:hypothetical protein
MVFERSWGVATFFVVLSINAWGSQAQDKQEIPRFLTGKYEVWKNQAVLHDVELLPGGAYKLDDRRGQPLGQGTYNYDAKAGRVIWTSGPYKDSNYTGGFSSEHKIRVSARSYAVNTRPKGSDGSAPALGKYTAREAFIFFTLLPGGKYKTYELIGEKLVGEGEYSFDAMDKAVKWINGPNKERGYYTACTSRRRSFCGPNAYSSKTVSMFGEPHVARGGELAQGISCTRAVGCNVCSGFS